MLKPQVRAALMRWCALTRAWCTCLQWQSGWQGRASCLAALRLCCAVGPRAGGAHGVHAPRWPNSTCTCTPSRPILTDVDLNPRHPVCQPAPFIPPCTFVPLPPPCPPSPAPAPAPTPAPAPAPTPRFNERDYRWVALETWTFSTNFDVPACMLQATPGTAASGAPYAPGMATPPAVDLLLEGVDTVADVVLNGRLLARVANFHRRVGMGGVGWGAASRRVEWGGVQHPGFQGHGSATFHGSWSKKDTQWGKLSIDQCQSAGVLTAVPLSQERQVLCSCP